MHPGIELLRPIRTFPSLVKYLRNELDWPIESDNFDDLTFDYELEVKRGGDSGHPSALFKTGAGMTKIGKGDWKAWLALSKWANETGQINTFWIDFAREISVSLKTGKKLTDKQKEDMTKCWKQAVKKGFKPEQ